MKYIVLFNFLIMIVFLFIVLNVMHSIMFSDSKEAESILFWLSNKIRGVNKKKEKKK